MQSWTAEVTYKNQRGVLSCPLSLQSRIAWILTASYMLVTSLCNIAGQPVHAPTKPYLGRWQQKNMHTVLTRIKARLASLDCWVTRSGTLPDV